jgi:hypothetical protein
MESKSERPMPVFKNVSGRSLMVYTFTDRDEVINYQLQMLANNSIPGILKAGTISLDGEIHLQYDITSLVPLKKLLERRKIGRMDFLDLIRNIAAVVEGMEQYLLDFEKIVFDSSFIFADPQDLKLGFAYLPVMTLDNKPTLLRSFLLDLIINDIQFTDEQSDNFVQKLLEVLKSEDFKTSDLRAYIKDMEPDRHVKATEPQPVPPQTLIDEDLVPQVMPEGKPVIKVSKMGFPNSSYIIMGSVIVILIIFLITLLISGVISPGNPDSLLSLFGFMLICGAVLYLVYSKVFSPDKKTEKIALPQRVEYVNKAFTVPAHLSGYKENRPSKPVIKPFGKEIISSVETAKPEAASGSIGSMTAFDAGRPLPASEREVAAVKNDLPADKHKDKTVILDRGNLKLPHLKRTMGNSFETIVLKRFPFMLGRLESQVDYCINNPAIGKLHAEILKTPDDYAISDINSLNGTFVNDERVQPGQSMIIKNGDRIVLGNEEFVFYE